MVNGVLLENGQRKTSIRVKTANANILRLRDAIDEHDVTSPLTQVYYTSQCIVAGALDANDVGPILADNIQKSAAECETRGIDTDEILALAEQKEFYALMRILSPVVRSPQRTPTR